MKQNKIKKSSRIGYLLIIILCSFMGVVVLFRAVPPVPNLAASENRELDKNENLKTFPVGSYHCLEFEWGLIWNSEDLVLLEDGTSLYLYSPYSFPHPGTWIYTPTTQLMSLTNFYWETLNVTPDLLWASRIIKNFEIAIRCTPREDAIDIQITSITPEPYEVGELITITFAITSTIPGFYGGPAIVRADTGEMCHDPWAGLTGSCTLTSTVLGEHTLIAIFPGTFEQPYGFSQPITHSVILPPLQIFLPFLKRE